MIRGTIDLVSSDSVVGWVHSNVTSVRNSLLLAFIGDRCVGSGRVDVYRRDLAEVGLGDGYVGFHFGITVTESDVLDQLIVRFEGSDFSLLQRDQAVMKPRVVLRMERADYSQASINWLREQGWIGQVEFDFLKQVTKLGLHDRSLRLSRREALDAAVEVKRMLELFHQASLTIEQEDISLAGLTSADIQRDPDMLPIIALHTDEGSLNILEGSHREPPGERLPGDVGSVRYLLRQDRLLFVDARASFTCEGSSPALLFRARSPANMR